MKTYVLGFCFNQSLNKVVLIRKKKPDWQASRLNGVGGSVEQGETTLAAMVREFREETGWQAHPEWICFGRLRCAVPDDVELYLFRGRYDTVPGPYMDGPEGLVNVHYVSSVLTGESQGSKVVPNARWLILMALNHATGDDRAEFFEIAERSAPRDFVF